GRVTLAPMAWSRVAAGPWQPVALGASGRPQGVLILAAEQEDELRAFCNLVERRSRRHRGVTWALRRFELGCERESSLEALTDHLLALRGLLEPEGTASGMLPGRLAVLCADAAEREELARRISDAVAFERAAIGGGAVKPNDARVHAEEVATHLRAL